MTPLRQRMIDDMQLRGLSARTQEAYVGGVAQLAGYYHRSPRRHHGGGAAAVFPLPDEREEGRSRHGDDRAVRDPVFL